MKLEQLFDGILASGTRKFRVFALANPDIEISECRFCGLAVAVDADSDLLDFDGELHATGACREPERWADLDLRRVLAARMQTSLF